MASKGRFGKYGGQYVPEIVMPVLNQLEEAYNKYKDDPDFLAELRKYYQDLLFKVPISRTVRRSEAPSYGAPICYHDPYGKGALEYAAVSKELMMRI